MSELHSYVSRFRETVAELTARGDVAVTRFWVAPPVTEVTIEKVHAALGFSLSDELLTLYRQANGLALQWFARGTRGFRSRVEPVERPFETPPKAEASRAP